MDRRLFLAVGVTLACLIANAPSASAQTCAFCGDGIVDAPEACDPPGSLAGCPTGQTCDACCGACAVVCGDGVLDASEFCDPDTAGGPCPTQTACNATCTACEGYCGNSVIDGGELCDPPLSQSTCLAGEVCRHCDECSLCGNGVVDPGEACDFVAGAGCTAGICRNDCSACRSRCSSLELKASSLKLQTKLKCYLLAMGKGIPVDPACLAKAEVKFSTLFAKAVSIGDCFGSVDAATIEAKVDAFLNDLTSEIAPAP